MGRRNKAVWAVVIVVVLAAAGYAILLHSRAERDVPVVELVQWLPTEASSLVYVDLAALRHSSALASLKDFAPDAQKEPEYAHFVHDTGFDFERDLDRVAIAVVTRGDTRVFYAVADGRFDVGKIGALALRSGKQELRGGQVVFSVPVSGSPRPVSFSFAKRDRILLTDGGDLDSFFRSSGADPAAAERKERALRLAGSPVFGVLHPEPAALRALSERIPGGLRSEQLTALAENFRWITFAARPDGERTRIVIEAESISEEAAGQMAGLLENLLLLARTALEFPGGRARMAPAERAAFLDLLQSAEVSRIDRGKTKAVRLVISAGPPVIEAILASPTHTAPGSH